MKQQKIKKIIINIGLILTFLSLCLFYNFWNVPFINLMQERFSIVSIKDNLIVHFISVGEADAIAINLPDGKVMLIDTGWSKTNVSLNKYINNKVLNNSLNKNVDYLVLSHADLDHSGGARKLVKELNVKKVFLPTFNTEKEQYLDLLKDIEENCEYEIVDKNINISNDEYKIDIISSPLKDTSNNSSSIVKLEYMNKSFLFTGDIDSKVENLLVEEYTNFLDVDVLKVAHHGSKFGTSKEFLNCVTPEYAVICVGNNSYGHPTSEVIDNLTNVEAEILRTDVDGDIVFVVGENYDLQPNTKEIYFTKFSLDYRILIYIVVSILVINTVIVTFSIFIKPKKRKKDFD